MIPSILSKRNTTPVEAEPKHNQKMTPSFKTGGGGTKTKIGIHFPFKIGGDKTKSGLGKNMTQK